MPDLTYIPDHEDRAVADLYFQHRYKERIPALARAIAGAFQTLEDAAFDLLVSTTLSAAAVDQLDLWGKIVGEKRRALDDDDYRRFIQARILANLSEGSTDRMIRVFRLITGADSVRFFSHHPAGFRLTAYTSAPLSERVRDRVRDMMESIRPAGVGMSLTESLDGDLAFSTSGAGFGSNFSRMI